VQELRASLSHPISQISGYATNVMSRKHSYQSSGSFITNWWAAGVQKIIDAPDKAGALGGIGQANFVDQLDDDQLQNVTEVLNLLDARAEEVQGPILVGVDQHHECVPFAWHVLKFIQIKISFFQRTDY
jgi:hypothetical protein